MFSAVTHIPIKGTSDVILSEEHERLMNMSYEFAGEYNKEIARLLRAQGASKCHEGVDWGAAHNKLTEFVWSLNDDISMQGHVGGNLEKEDDETDFTVLLPEPVTEELKQKLCNSIKEDLPGETISIEVKARQNIEDVEIIWCQRGVLQNAT